MANRFVWSKNSVDIDVTLSRQPETIHPDITINGEDTDGGGSPDYATFSVAVYKSLGIDSRGRTVGLDGTTYTSRRYYIDDRRGQIDLDNGLPGYIPGQWNDYYYREKQGSNDSVVIGWGSGFSLSFNYIDNCREATATQIKGTLQGYVSSASSGRYPSDGVSGNSYVSKRPPYPLTHYPPPKNPPIPGHTGCPSFGLLRGWIRSFR